MADGPKVHEFINLHCLPLCTYVLVRVMLVSMNLDIFFLSAI